ncbi:MAG TPA: S41 family peptidase [Steroidobacteraceae bacterium]|jgi:tricorn protease|nr:S41 family peptidase [Steroidobacteraceae bacterium]
MPFIHAMQASTAVILCCFASAALSAGDSAGGSGYYRYPSVHADTVVFTSEGDLWTVALRGGTARRLTSNSGVESLARISSDGRLVAFVGQYEGPSEVYTVPLAGGIPERRTWNGDSVPAAWAPDGRLVVSTNRFSTLPDPKLVLLDEHGGREIVPLAEGAEAAYSSDGRSLFFTRWRKQPSFTKRYQGGYNETLWRFDGHGEAVPLSANWAGTSTNPMFWDQRLYFLSDRDGVMNVYSMDAQGGGVRQESHQGGFDIASASLSDGHIVYACGGDLWSLDLKSGREELIPISTESDFDQLRDHWVKTPLNYLTSVHISADGSRAIFTARGEVFTLPAKNGRIIKVAAKPGVRYREARFLPDGKNVVALSTETGETEFWKYPANGVGAPQQWTHDSKVLRWDGVPSPDGKWLAHRDKDQQLWIYDIGTRQDKRIAQSRFGDFDNLSWSPDSRWLAFTQTAANQFLQISVFATADGSIQFITSDRYNSISPVWSSDGKWLYFLSDRSLKTTVASPWGARQPEPHFDRPVKIYELALLPNLRSPFLPADELHPDTPAKDDEKSAEAKSADGNASTEDKHRAGGKAPSKASMVVSGPRVPEDVKIDFTNLQARLREIPAPPGNYDALQITDKRLCWLDGSDEAPPKLSLKCLGIDNKGDEAETIASDIKNYEISLDRKKLLVAKARNFYIVDSSAGPVAFNDPKALEKATVNLSAWSFFTNPRADFRGIFSDAWRLERDYFYDRNMQGVDWNAMRARYLPLVDRVSDREELNDVIAQMVSELSALHIFVRGGDIRKPPDQIGLAALGARFRRDEKAGGFVVEHVYVHDPDLPNNAPPLSRPESRVEDGEVIVSINGESALSAPDERALLRGKAGTQVLLRVKSPAGETRDVLAMPIKAADEANLRYSEWEYTRRLKVDAESNGQIGYVHLRAMGAEDIDQWAREYYPIYKRQGLIIDVRHNHGGNIDSWLLEKLLRQAWFYWQPRVGDSEWNMQYAFRGHMVVLCDQETASDGEAFTEGFHRFKLGKTIGVRTWGGEIWLSSSNFEADGGIATAAELGVYGPEGKWLIEGRGVEPDIVIDNLPHGTFTGSDAQLKAAVDLLKQQIAADPRPVPARPPYPNKAFPYKP